MPDPATGTEAEAGTRALHPADLAEAHQAVVDSAGALLFRGAGTKLAWGSPPERTDAVISTRRLDALVEHSAGDMIAIVGAGMPLARLQAALAEHGQWLAIDPPRAGPAGADGSAGATVGGIFAADDSGPRRQRYGSMRDLVLGVTVILADGTIGRAGGRVVKNVAGYDLMRLLCGSLGTLGLVTELVVRLHPVPETSTTLRIPAEPATARALTAALLRASAPLVTALEWSRGALHVRFEGRPPGVRSAVAAAQRTAAEHGAGDSEPLTGDDEARLWDDLSLIPAARSAGAAAGASEPANGTAGGDVTIARAVALPERFPAVAAALSEAAQRNGVEADLLASTGLGLHTAALSGADASAHAATVTAWRRSLAELGGTVVLRDRRPGVEQHVDAWLDPSAPSPSALPLMRRVKLALDPGRRCAPGRFLGGL